MLDRKELVASFRRGRALCEQDQAARRHRLAEAATAEARKLSEVRRRASPLLEGLRVIREESGKGLGYSVDEYADGRVCRDGGLFARPTLYNMAILTNAQRSPSDSCNIAIYVTEGGRFWVSPDKRFMECNRILSLVATQAGRGLLDEPRPSKPPRWRPAATAAMSRHRLEILCFRTLR